LERQPYYGSLKIEIRYNSRAVFVGYFLYFQNHLIGGSLPLQCAAYGYRDRDDAACIGCDLVDRVCVGATLPGKYDA